MTYTKFSFVYNPADYQRQEFLLINDSERSLILYNIHITSEENRHSYIFQIVMEPRYNALLVSIIMIYPTLCVSIWYTSMLIN